jgi:hypothetical protein
MGTGHAQVTNVKKRVSDSFYFSSYETRFSRNSAENAREDTFISHKKQSVSRETDLISREVALKTPENLLLFLEKRTA